VCVAAAEDVEEACWADAGLEATGCADADLAVASAAALAAVAAAAARSVAAVAALTVAAMAADVVSTPPLV